MTEADQKFIRMTQAPVERLVCEMAIPTIAIMLISSLYNMADTYFVGALGTSATAAVGVVFSLMAIIQAVGFFFGHGSGNYISRELGAQNIDKAEKMAATGLISSLSIGAFIGIAGLLFLELLVFLLGATPTIAPYACDYMFYILIGTPFMVASLMLNNLLRFQGSAFYGMIGMLTGAILNIGLDPLFIFVFKMGVGGAALATIISQAASFFLLLYGCTKKGNVRIRIKNFAPGLKIYREIIRGGFPSLCRQSIASIATIIMNTIAGSFGDAAIAAISIVGRVILFASSALIGLGQGFQPVCGFNYGAKRYDRVKKAFWFCVKIATVTLTAISIAGIIFAPNVIALFRKDDVEVIQIGVLTLRLQCYTLPLMGWAIASNMMLQTIGKTARASILAFARQGLFLIPFLFMLPPLMGILGLQLSQPISDIATFILSIPLTVGVLKEMTNESPSITAEGEVRLGH